MKKFIQLSCFFIFPLFSLVLSFSNDLIKYNFTFFYSTNEYKLVYIFFVLFLSFILYISLFYIKKDNLLYFPKNKHIIFLVISFLIGALIPYNKTNSLSSFLHVSISYFSLIYFNYILYIIYCGIKYKSEKLYNFCLYFYLVTFSFCLFLTIYFGSINSLVEVIYILAVCFIIGLVTKR